MEVTAGPSAFECRASQPARVGQVTGWHTPVATQYLTHHQWQHYSQDKLANDEG